MLNTVDCYDDHPWYYGLDGRALDGSVDLLAVVLHEMGHGLGFQTYVNLETGQKFANRNDAFVLFLEDHSTGETWNQMTNAERLASATDTTDLHWAGAGVSVQTGNYTQGVSGGHMQMYAPGAVSVGLSVSHFDTEVAPNELMEPSLKYGVGNTALTKALLEDIGWPLFTNFAPVMGGILDTSSAGPIQFVVSDHDHTLDELDMAVTSSNTAVIDSNDFSITGWNNLRTLTFSPVGNGVSTITVTISDGIDSVQTSFELTVTSANTAPVVSITAPATNSDYTITDLLTLAGTAADAEDGDLSGSIQWSSDIDGPLGTGSPLNSALTAGKHTITASSTVSAHKSTYLPY